MRGRRRSSPPWTVGATSGPGRPWRLAPSPTLSGSGPPPSASGRPGRRCRRVDGLQGRQSGSHAASGGMDRPGHARALRVPGQRQEGAGCHPPGRTSMGVKAPPSGPNIDGRESVTGNASAPTPPAPVLAEGTSVGRGAGQSCSHAPITPPTPARTSRAAGAITGAPGGWHRRIRVAAGGRWGCRSAPAGSASSAYVSPGFRAPGGLGGTEGGDGWRALRAMAVSSGSRSSFASATAPSNRKPRMVLLASAALAKESRSPPRGGGLPPP